ncbi:MAG: carboxypeptidase-like regulatory domain-containing protein [Gemmatimonadota bacterium]
MRPTQPILVLLVSALISMQPLSAQSIGGKVVEAGTEKPIGGALVVLLDAQGQRRSAVLTDTAGHFYVRAPGPGVYRLRTERIGFRSVMSPILTVGAKARLSQLIEAPIEPIVLDTISAEGSGRCHTSREVGAATYLLWEEARKALAITALERERGMPYQVLLYERTRDLVSGSIIDQRSRLHSAYGKTPFRSESAGDLADYGFVRDIGANTYQYFGLDAPTLLSDAFLDTHCFRIRQPGAEEKGLIGLAFEPTPTNHNADITGVLWLDRRSAELRHITFRFTRHLYPLQLPTAPFGGRIEFRRLADGAWIVDRWWLRMPQMPVGLINAAVRIGRPTDTRTDDILVAQRAGVTIREEGGEVRFVAQPGLLQNAFGDATVEGVVYDSARGAPLAGATVFLTRTRRSATTNADGHYRLARVPGGPNAIAFFHPYADSLGLPVRPRPVVLRAGQRTEADLFIPRASGCPVSAVDTTHAAIRGFVHDAARNAPISHALVIAQWLTPNTTRRGLAGTSRKQTTRTDADGRFLLCGFPLEADVTLTARHGRAETTVEIHVDAPGIVHQDLQVAGVP